MGEPAVRSTSWLAAWLAAMAVGRNERSPDSGLRDQVLDHVDAYPGLHLSEIARQLEIPTNHAKYHLRRLERERLISSIEHDGYWRFFPRTNGSLATREVVDHRDKRMLALLRRPRPLRIVIHLLTVGEATHGALAQAADISPATASYHLGKLVEQEVLDRREEGRQVYFSLRQPARVQALLERYEPPDPLVEGFLEAWEALGI